MIYTFYFSDGASITGHLIRDNLDREAYKYIAGNPNLAIKTKLPGSGPGEFGKIYKPVRTRDGFAPYFNHTIGRWVDSIEENRRLAKQYGLVEKGRVTAEEHQKAMDEKRKHERGALWTNDKMLKEYHEASGIEIDGNFAEQIQKEEIEGKLSEGVYMENESGAEMEDPNKPLDRKAQRLD